ncbi:reprolysin-like metallopeptidase [Rhizobium leguminosarum]|uniref:reprolysin-like metallopeptidase n=1 Tax=Rhizobium leguminosarum TaxID=384 RepID=UPI001011796F|nr:matrix metalloproteinase-11 [Rhizobium leguminosarum]
MVAKKKGSTDVFTLKPDTELKSVLKGVTHVYHGGACCETDGMGFALPNNRSITEIVVDATQGFIPLWDSNVTLNWRFQDASLQQFVDPEAVKAYLRTLLGETLLAWKTAVPIKFSETSAPWDFEIVVRAQDNCSAFGCTLARAFFPDAGQHELVLFPKMFEQVRNEQIETLAHELGHVFGLRHFFAKVSETGSASEIFGTHEPLSIMNYGEESKLTTTDMDDLTRLYREAWSGSLTEINGTPIRLMRPFSHFRQKAEMPPQFALVARTIT